MSESLKYKRVVFPKSDQHIFLKKVEYKLGITSKALASILNIHPRTLADWKREKFLMSLEAFNKIFKLTGLETPHNIKIRDQFSHASKAGKIGGRATYEKYGIVGGNPEIRKIKWVKWWNEKGKTLKIKILQPKSFKSPNKNIHLAEFIGIMLGDGSLNNRQIAITLNYKEKEYGDFVSKLCEKLFDVTPSLYLDPKGSVRNIVISRTLLTDFLTEKLGMKKGNKITNQVDIPQWIKDDKKLSIACLRGLIDTDGSLIIHKYRSKNKLYTYKKIGFTNRSLPLLLSVNQALDSLGIKNRFMGKYDIRVESQKDVEIYFKLVGTNNPKHCKRYSL